MKLRDILLGILFFSAVILGLNVFLVNTANEYGVTLDNDTWGDTYDIISEMETLSGEQQAIVGEEDTDTSWYEPFVKIGSAVKMTGRTIGMFQGIASHFLGEKVVNANPLLATIVGVAIVIIVIFAIASVLWKYAM